MLFVAPTDGGVGDHAAAIRRELEQRGSLVQHLAIAREPTAAWRGIMLAARHRRAIDRATVVHVEFGRLDAGVYWFALAASLRRRDIAVVAHDAPVLLLAPAASLVPWRGIWAQRLGYGVLGRLFDGPLRRLFDRRLQYGAVLTEAAADGWRATGGRQIAVVRQGADPPTGPPVAPSRGSYVLFAGFIGPVKGLDELLDAWPAAADGSDFELLIAGGNADDGSPYVAEMRARADGLERVRWLGAVDAPTLARLFAEAAIVCVPYRSSNPGSAILVRAMVEGRAIVATDVLATAGAIDDGAALIVPPSDAPELASAIRALIADGELRDRLGSAAARAAGVRFTWPQTVDDLLELYGAIRADSTRSAMASAQRR